MKKYLFAAAFTLVASTVQADPTQHNVAIYCPGINAISHFGEYIAGYGTETIFGENRSIYFKTTQWPSGIPNDLSTYASTATSYNSTSGEVVCSYMSSDSNNAPFDLSYDVSNGVGGLVIGKNNNTIVLQLPVGLRRS